MMKTITFKRTVLSATALLMSFSVFAQEEKKFEIAPAADLVSSYVWRGMYQTGPAIQPSLSMSYAGLSLTAWGSTDFSSSSDETKAKEFDLTLGYGIGGFSIAVTDYWWSGEGARYGRYNTDHYFEGTIGYNFGEKFPLSLTWSTMFAGGDKNPEDGDRYYSSYFEAAYDVNVWGISFQPAVGISPYKSQYSDGFGLNSISLKASKEIKLSESFSLPVFTQVIAAPEHDNVFLVFGISL